jgi:3-keto-disaccharide hydrolase
VSPGASLLAPENDAMRNILRPRALIGAALLLAILSIGGPAPGQGRYLHGITWPEPPVITPGEGSAAPSDAIVLFNGKNFDEWDGAKGWKVDADGGFTVKGRLTTKKSFGDIQLHLEFATPKPPKGKDQGRGNNGIGLMGARYEVQVLDSYQNKTYPEGQCAAVYNQRPPMVNASRKPGEWQTFDIFFTAPRFKDSKLVTPAYATVIHNGILVQNHMEIMGGTVHRALATYQPHGPAGPLRLQDHGNPMRFRNIWIRALKSD